MQDENRAVVAEHEKLVCNVGRDLGSDRAVTAAAALPLVCDHAPTGVSSIANEHLLNFVEAQPDLSHGCPPDFDPILCWQSHTLQMLI
jgi:hypothetical protein